MTIVNNPLPDLPAEAVLELVSQVPPMELSTLAELYFFIEQRESEFFKETLVQLLNFVDAEILWNILDYLWLNDEDRAWIKPLMLVYLRQKLYFDEEFNI